MLDLQSTILERLRAKLDLDKIPMDRLHEEDLWQRAERATIDLVETLESSGELPKYIDQDTLIKETLNEALESAKKNKHTLEKSKTTADAQMEELKQELASGVHALSLTTLTPDEDRS